MHRVGVNMGDKMLGKGRSQPHGHFEDRQFLRLDEQILKRLNGTWDHPPSQSAIEAIAPEYAGQIRRMIATRDGKNDMWGFKDPRSALLWPLYEPHLSHDPHLIAVFRRPSKVAESLQTRNGMSLQTGTQLANYYNRLIVAAIEDFVGL